jgi:hypothetical protein
MVLRRNNVTTRAFLSLLLLLRTRQARGRLQCRAGRRDQGTSSLRRAGMRRTRDAPPLRSAAAAAPTAAAAAAAAAAIHSHCEHDSEQARHAAADSIRRLRVARRLILRVPLNHASLGNSAST